MKAEKIEEATNLFQEKLTAWVNNKEKEKSAYEYEKSYVEAMQNIEREVLQIIAGEPGSRNVKKKVQTIVGYIQVSKKHILSKTPGNFRISSYTQEMMCYFGQMVVFKDAEEVFKVSKGIDISAKQIENICHHYGLKMEERMNQEISQGHYKYGEQEKAQVYYAMLDGSVYLTREQKWMEAKLARIFSAKNHIDAISKDRGFIAQSNYLAHLGNHKDFLMKLEYYIDPLKNLIIMGDGARWIWNWADTFYPESTQILDFFHAKEHLGDFGKEYFKDEKQKTDWINECSELLLNDGIKKIIAKLKKMGNKNNKQAEAKRKNLIGYYKENTKRMYYKTFLDKGYLIGSGPIESAHRNVLQQRLKLSGQRWTVNGFQQIANLRALNKSDKWNEVVDFISTAA